MLPIATHVTEAARGPSVCVSVTLVHPAKAVGQNEMSFGRVVPSNTLDRGPGPPREGEILRGRNPDL